MLEHDIKTFLVNVIEFPTRWYTRMITTKQRNLAKYNPYISTLYFNAERIYNHFGYIIIALISLPYQQIFTRYHMIYVRRPELTHGTVCTRALYVMKLDRIRNLQY